MVQKMVNIRKVTDDTWWVGASDRRIGLFENIYPVPDGMAYNSYLIMDEKTCLMDGVDASVTGQYLENVAHVLAGKSLDYLVVQHMEPDHCAVIPVLLARYPGLKVVASAKAIAMIGQFYGIDVSGSAIAVKEGDTLELGRHTLNFITAPMVHWPEVIMSHDPATGALFSADAFGSFGALSGNIFADEVNWERDILDEARRYYVNIVGKYGAQVAAVLKKASALEIKMLLPLHGHIWRENLETIINRYETWAGYVPEEDSAAIFYGSIYGNTANAAEILAVRLAEKGVKNIAVFDTSKTDTSEMLAAAFKYKVLVFASATYNGEIFDPVNHLLTDIKNHNLSGRTVGIIDNGTWAATAGKKINEAVGAMKNMTVLEPVVSIKSAVDTDTHLKLIELADAIKNCLS